MFVRRTNPLFMRKRSINAVESLSTSGAEFLPIETIAQVEVSSEAAGSPIEAALSPSGSGWRAAAPGEQRIRILFDQPERVRRLTLKFVERERPRTQEFVLTWSADAGSPAHIIIRQQWTFSPAGSTTESEVYDVELDHVRMLELMIKPDISDSTAVATLAELRVFADR